MRPEVDHALDFQAWEYEWWNRADDVKMMAIVKRFPNFFVEPAYDSFRQTLRTMLRDSTLATVNREIVAFLENAPNPPSFLVQKPFFPTPKGLVYFDRPYQMRGKIRMNDMMEDTDDYLEDVVTIHIRMMGWGVADNVIVLSMWGKPDQEDIKGRYDKPLADGLMWLGRIPVNELWDGYRLMSDRENEGAEDNPGRKILPIIIKYLAFVNQRLLVSGEVEASRAVRKRFAREQPDLGTTVQFVTLRKRQYPHQTDGEVHHLNWACQWWVSGHWRVYDRGTPLERAVWIEPYIKGPEDKPLKAPKETIYVVSR